MDLLLLSRHSLAGSAAIRRFPYVRSALRLRQFQTAEPPVGTDRPPTLRNNDGVLGEFCDDGRSQRQGAAAVAGLRRQELQRHGTRREDGNASHCGHGAVRVLRKIFCQAANAIKDWIEKPKIERNQINEYWKDNCSR